jgi:hypothetical protein
VWLDSFSSRIFNYHAASLNYHRKLETGIGRYNSAEGISLASDYRYTLIDTSNKSRLMDLLQWAIWN